MINNILIEDDLDNFLIDNKNKIVMLYFGSERCGPCKTLKDKLKKNKSEIPTLKYVYIDIDKFGDLCDVYEIKYLPTLIFVSLDDNLVVNIIDRIDGYDWMKLIFIYNKINIEK